MSLPTQGVLLLHNPRCSKSRQTLALLEERGIEFTERRYLEDPLDEGELKELARRLGRPAGEWVRRKEATYGEAGLGQDASDAELIAAMARHPVLMERPIVIRDEQARVGRPPEDVLGLF